MSSSYTDIIADMPRLDVHPLVYVFEIMKIKQRPDTLWLEFGVFGGRTINYIADFASPGKVHGFDSFEGLPEDWRDCFGKGAFNMNGALPQVKSNVELVKGWFEDTLPKFVQAELTDKNKKVSFLHLDADLYSSTKCILNELKDHFADDCIVVFDELLEYPGFDGETGELRAFYEFTIENTVKYEWIGGLSEQAVLVIHGVEGRENI
jgi:Macrocin-O-methyltransferase (TylF)